MQFFSPIFIKAFSITFFGEWGDKSQIATIGLAADENPFGVVLGGIIAQALCTTAAVLGGKSLASQISEKMVGTELVSNSSSIVAIVPVSCEV
jgi:putative Ca2+/H+ antiporter (TMEM165/GDT1 family)